MGAFSGLNAGVTIVNSEGKCGKTACRITGQAASGEVMSYWMEASDHAEDQVEALVTQPPPNPFNSLAVIGNGFDLALGLKSSFADFRSFFNDLSKEDLAKGDDTLQVIFEEIETIAGPNWRDFEGGLAELDLPMGVADLDYPDAGDLSENDSLSAEGAEYGESFKLELSRVFQDWVMHLPGAPTPPSVGAVDLVSGSDGILSFNYTGTLTTVFGINNAKVLPIHGNIASPAPLYFGCPRVDRIWWGAGGSNGLSGAIREQALKELIGSLTKEPRTDLLDSFLRCCTRLNKISSFGFSFGEADHPYVKHLIDNYCDVNTIWTQHCYKPYGDLEDSDDVQNFLDLMKDLEFPGKTELIRI